MMSTLKLFRNNSFFVLIVLSLLGLVNAHAAAEGRNTTKELKGFFSKDKWSASLDSIHYSFSGEEPARGNIYSFEDVITDIRMVSLNFKSSSTLTFSLVTQHINIYTETFLNQEITKLESDLFFDRTHGLGDTLLKVIKTSSIKDVLLTTDLALSFPTGSVSEKNKNAPQLNYPYNLQLGSGTFDFILTQTVIKNLSAKHQLGGFAQGRLYTGLNDEGYRRGDEVAARLWYSYILNPNIVTGIWLNYHLQKGIKGEDRTFGRSQLFEFYHNSRQFWNVTPHVNLSHDINKNFKLRAMVGLPVWQISENIDDVQLFTRWFTQVGLDARF